MNDITINTQNNHLVSNQIIDLFSPDNLRAVLIKSLYTSFLLNSPDETLLRKYYNIADNAFEFLKNKSLNKPKIRIYTPNLTQHKFELDYTIIEILTEDLPFLTDAFPEELTENGFNIYRIFQSIIYTKRDTDGNLESLELENTPSYSKEVLLHFHISSIPNLEIFQPVEENLYKILNDIKIAVADWPTMLHHQKLYIEKSLPTLSQEIKNDIEDFINWNSKNFIFLGYAHLNLTKEGFEQFEKLGILSFKYNDYLIKELNEDIFTNELTGIEHFIQVGRFSTKSSINAHKNLSYFCFKEYDQDTKLKSIRLFTGIFTSKLAYQSVDIIPLLKQKRDYIIQSLNFSQDSFEGKELVRILEDLPKEELFYISKENLLNLALQILSFIFEPRVRLLTFEDISGNFISNLIFVPKELFTYELAEKLNDFLKSVFGGVIEKNYTQLNNRRLTYFHIVLNTEGKHEKSPVNIEKIEKRLRLLTHRWLDDLYLALNNKYGNVQAKKLYTKYKDAFPAAYRDRFAVDPSALKDLSFIEKAAIDQGTVFDLYKFKEDPEDIFRLKIYTNDKKISLYRIMPIIENLGFKALESYTYRITPLLTRAIWVNDFYLSVSLARIPKITDIKLNAQEALYRIYYDLMHNDGLNKLIISAGFNWQQVRMIRALIKYMKQVGFNYSQELIESCINEHTDIVNLIYQLYDTLFNPSNRENVEYFIKDIETTIEDKLNAVASDVEDKILRDLYNTIKAILRTNYYQTINGKPKDYISFKFDSSKVPNLPEPRPFREIFFHSKKAKGIHLRGGKVARGGLRWSDRIEDFRREILGLMKAQNTKNAVIVPVGSKGGFVLSNQSSLLPNQVHEEAKEAYRNYLRGLLDLTDNIVDGQIVPPKDVVCLDESDPYLVVAADKGTATFSDIANGISKEYNFWLGDAFASGGSAGYDHKKIGITAKGGWISVQKHFYEMGVSIESDNIKVVGIGDMAGDVFGNGMLLSEHIKLIAAFNHMHIFIDPQPDPKKTFHERQRLFRLARSTWDDYDKSLISKGGGVFERKAKFIELTPEIRELFKIEETRLHPSELINRILKSHYDLLWNGGIGTYIKSSHESHLEVGDKANDLLRVNGNELNCKVIGEGGNLGCTQFGRIEFALNSGRLNTDFIDNSAGVDCSDHEVNIKITFQKAIESGKISIDERNRLLVEMTDEVEKLVLEDNYKQNQALSIAIFNAQNLLALQARLIDKLEEKELLNRKLEFLPTKQEITRRQNENLGLTRPELSILLAYSKIDVYQQILNSSIPDDLYFENYLIGYFPKLMQEKFSDEIRLHRLKREIIATVIINKMINRMGMTFFNLVAEDTGLPACDITRAYIVANNLFKIDELWNKIELLEDKVSSSIQNKLFSEIIHFVQTVTFWLLRNLPQPIRINSESADFFSQITEIIPTIEKMVTEDLASDYSNKIDNFTDADVPIEVAKSITSLLVLNSAFDIILITVNSGVKVDEATRIYFDAGHRLNLEWLNNKLDSIKPHNFWERLSIKTLKEEISDKQRNISTNIIKSFGAGAESIERWALNNRKHLERYDQLLQNLMQLKNVDLSMIVIAVKRLDFL